MQFFLAILLMFAFYKAPRVTAGDVPRASDWNALAEAANIKARSGLGDLHYREGDYCINWARQIRNQDQFGAMPPQAEYFEINFALTPESGITTPIAGPGEFEGTNVTSPPGTFVFGAAGVIDSEEVRIGDPTFILWQGFNPPATLEEWWELSKSQRGAIDPVTGSQNCPSISAAHSAENVWWNTRTPHGKTTGGFFPTPVVALPDCGADNATGLGISSYEYKFTGLRTDVVVPSNHGTVTADTEGRPVITYAGSCPDWTTNFAADHVQGIARSANYYLVFFVDGFDILPTFDWLEGPYTEEGHLTRHDAGHFDRAVFETALAFRGTPAQRNPDDFDIEKVAFSFQEFFDGQYFLAPNKGREFAGELIPEYPRGRVAAAQSLPSGTKLKFGSSEKRSYEPGYVLGGCFAKATNLFAPVTLEILSGKTVIARLTLTPAAPQALKMFPKAVTPDPLTVRLANKARFTAPGEIIFEANELYPYRPDHWDAYMLLRLSATQGGDESTGNFIDGSGVDEQNALKIYQNYLKYGAVVNLNAAGVRTQGEAINTNPVYEAQRTRLNSLFRMFHRNQFLSYGTDAQGRPVLRFKRYVFGLYKTAKADNFEGIAPSYKGVSEVVEGVEYVVRSHTGGKVSYNGRKYLHEQRFVGAKESAFALTGDALLLEYEGIRATAPKKGYSNEWLFSEEFHFYHPSPSSNWKQEAYADWFARGNRCHTKAEVLSFPAELSRIADLEVYPGSSRSDHLSPEAPSAWNYLKGLGGTGANQTASADFCASCPIYKAPYEIISATVEFVADGNDVVKLVFKEPFQRDPSAPASIDPNPHNWSDPEITALRAEPYRTTDNGLREYALYKVTGIHGSWKEGDAAANSAIQSQPDNPFGCIFPRFFATSLVKKVYADGNNTWDANDTRMAVDEMLKLEVKMRAWCEGAVDGFSTVNHICSGGTKPYDFTYENLCFKAFSGRAITRPQANTYLKAETFNQIAACLDELYMFRVEGGILEFQARGKFYDAFMDGTPIWGSVACPAGSGIAAIWEGAPPSPAFDSEDAWPAFGTPASLITATSSAFLQQCGPSSVSGILGVVSNKTDIEYRHLVNPNFVNAIPAIVQDLIDNNNMGVVGTLTRTITVPRKNVTTNIAETACTGTGDGPGSFWTGSSGWYWDDVVKETTECVMLSGGILSAGNAPGGSFNICSYADATPSGFSENGNSSGGVAQFQKLIDDGVAVIVVPMVEHEEAT